VAAAGPPVPGGRHPIRHHSGLAPFADSSTPFRMLSYLLQGMGYGFAAAVQPGPFQGYLAAQAVRVGWRQAVPMVFAPLLSDGPIIVLVLFVLSRVPPWWVQLLRFGGGFFVLYLAAGVFRSLSDATAHAPGPHTGRQGLLRATVVNLLNPGPYLFWALVTGPLLVTGWREAPVNGIGLLVGFYGAMLSTLIVILALFASAAQFGGRVTRGLLAASGVALAGSGLYQIALGIAAWWQSAAQ
jgi:threonine/homoserine/homoserine lactone efflux protein